MNTPGFTADSALYSSRRQYFLRPSANATAATVIPQHNPGPCYDWECLRYCEEMNPYNAAVCYEACAIPCSPWEPPEMLPAPV